MTCLVCCERRAHLALAARERLALCGGVRPYACKRKRPVRLRLRMRGINGSDEELCRAIPQTATSDVTAREGARWPARDTSSSPHCRKHLTPDDRYLLVPSVPYLDPLTLPHPCVCSENENSALPWQHCVGWLFRRTTATSWWRLVF